MLAIALLLLAVALVVASAQQPRANSAGSVTAQSPSGSAAELDQCRNGGVGATPVPCNPSTKNPLGWVNGNAQGQQAHWREGDSIAYRVVITGLAPNSVGNTLLFNWSTVHGSHHALDYITSYDRTETTSLTPSQFFANHNNPCSDVLTAANCNPPSPTTAFNIPSPITAGVLTNCGGSAGTFTGALPTGADMQIKGYGAPGTQITAVAYQSVQVSSGTGQCSTGFLVTFNAGSGSTVVLAWGGHIASQQDWGVGNSASFISGSPYHMFLDSLNGASTGAQDRALATSAIFFTPSISTTVIDDATGLPLVSPISAGDTVHDTATLTGASPTAGGTVTYRFWSGVNQCPSSSGFTTQTVTVSGGIVPPSASTAALAAGFYSYNASYSGDISSGGDNFPANSACEPFQVGKNPTTTATTLHNAADTSVISNGATLPLGSSVYDTAAVSGQVGTLAITGTVSFTFFTNGACSGTGSAAGTASVGAGGVAGPSSTEGPLTVGSYSFQATYNGDTSYQSSVSSCEPFSIEQAPTTTATTLHNAADDSIIANGASLPLGTSVYDTASVSGQVGSIAITGTVTFNYFTNAACSGTPAFTETVALGTQSTTQGPLIAGSYSFDAMYNGDTNYAASAISSCEPFSVNKAPTTTSTTLRDAADDSIVSNGASLPLGSSVYDTASVSGQVGSIAITGTVTFNFFTNGACSGTPFFTETVALGSASTVQGPLTTGSYSFDATYNGDSNYAASAISGCEPFSVAQAQTTTSTTLHNAADDSIITNGASVPLGTSVYDTASVSGQVGSIAITGTVTFNFFTNGICSGTPAFTEIVALGTQSTTQGPLKAGSYSFDAAYNGDSNYAASAISGCEPFTVNKAQTTTTTTLHNAADDSIVLNGASLPLASSVYDTASVSGQVGSIAITGTVTFNFFTNGICSGTPAFTETVALGSPSSTQGPLGAGSYSFDAAYNGDSNYAASAISGCEPFTVNQALTSTTTTLHNAAGGSIIANGASVTLGSSVYDTADVGPAVAPFAITGSVTFNFFANGACTGTPAFTETVAVGSPSSPQGPLTAGSYSFDAQYLGDTNYAASAVSSCEPFIVPLFPPSSVTTALFTSGNVPIALGGSVALGTSVYDTAMVNGQVGSIAITGTVSFFFFTNGACSGVGSAAGSAAVGAGGVAGPSDTEGPLMAGTYGFKAAYSGDSNYLGAVSDCEPFTVNQASTTTATTVFDAATDAAWAGTELPGASAYDTATVTASPFTPTGTVAYTFFMNGACTGTGVSAGTVTLAADGSVPNSATEGPLQAGSYSFQATYSGDSNYFGSTGPCEPFTVNQASSTTNTVVFDAATDAAWAGTELPGASAYDTATVTASPFTPTGTVAYTFFMNGACTGTGASAGTVTLDASGNVPISDTVGPLAAGSYSFQATYSGDVNYLGSTGPCEPFSVLKASPSITTQVSPASITLGGSATDTATLSGLLMPDGTGTVTFNVYSDASCTNLVFSSGSTPALVTANGNYVSDAFTPTAAGSYYWVASFSGDANNKAFTSSCGDNGETLTVNPSFGLFLDTNQCPFDVDSSVAGNQFLVNFQKSSTGTYKIASTNPGQFYYDAFFYGTPGSTATITITLPWPFVTQGATPVHVYSAFSMAGSGCVSPLNDVTGGFAISGPGASTGQPTVLLTTYPSQADGSSVTFTVTGTVPSSGLVFVTVHLLWGLNGSTGWSPVGSCSGKQCIADATNVGLGLNLPNEYAYMFGFTETHTSVSVSNTAYNENQFNR